MNKDRIKYLYNRYLNDSCLDEELRELEILLADPDNESFFNELLDESWKEIDAEPLTDMDERRAEGIFKRIVAVRRNRSVLRRQWMPLSAAAILLLGLGLTFFIFINRANLPYHKEQSLAAVKDILPANNGAVLTLPNGNKISLSASKKGIMVSSEKLLYNDGSSIGHSESTDAAFKPGTEEQEQFATLMTPIGGQYQVILSDGTRIWLNAGSRLRYPVSFIKEKRVVELDGEGYFEVAKDKAHPFIVKTRDQNIEVLGTHFDVNAYRDLDVIKTTLIEGAVKVSRNLNTTYPGRDESVILKPGQQSEVRAGSSSINLSYVNTDEAIDWKDGLFLFNNESVVSIMKRLSRWYNIEVVYRGNLENVRFVGTYSRNKGLNNLLKNIEMTGKVSFTTEEIPGGKERRIIVTANY